MIRMILAAAAAFALVSATPAFACPNCDQCAHKDQVAAADKAEKKDGEKKAVTCGCAGEGKECKCGRAVPVRSLRREEGREEGREEVLAVPQTVPAAAPRGAAVCVRGSRAAGARLARARRSV